MSKKNEVVYSVTSLPISPEEDRNKRFKFYAYAMLVRLVSIPLLFVVPIPWVIIPILLAVFIPAFAVVLANAANAPVSSSFTVPSKSIEYKPESK